MHTIFKASMARSFWYLLLILLSSTLHHEAAARSSGNGGAIAAGVLGGALFGGAIAASASNRGYCSPDDPGCAYVTPYWGGPYVYAGPVAYGYAPYGPYYGPGLGYAYIR